jgi:hypothetical protein
MKPKSPEPLFRPGQVITYKTFKKAKYVVERIVQGVCVLRHQSGSIEKHNINLVNRYYELDAKASDEHAVTKVLKKYLNGI